MGLDPSRDLTLQCVPRSPTGLSQPYQHNFLGKLSLRTRGLSVEPSTLQTISDLILHIISSAAGRRFFHQL